ncbi:hypothetical protein ACFSTC_49780 [Nonomuraea ferruginea]
MLLQFALCLVASRLVTTSLSSALRTRRGRDVLAVAAIGAVLLFQLPNLLINSDLGDPLSLLHGTAAVLRWTPSGMAAHAIADGGLVGVAELAVVALVVVAAAWLWIKALSRALVTPDVSNEAATVRRDSGLARPDRARRAAGGRGDQGAQVHPARAPLPRRLVHRGGGDRRAGDLVRPG